MSERNKLTPKQSLFCKEYLVDLNATQAAIRAGYSKNSARQTASANLSKPDIQNYIQELMKKREKKIEKTGKDVIEELAKLGFSKYEQKDIRITDKTKALEILAKHYGLLTEKHEHTGKDGKPIQTENLTKTVIYLPGKMPTDPMPKEKKN